MKAEEVKALGTHQATVITARNAKSDTEHIMLRAQNRYSDASHQYDDGRKRYLDALIAEAKKVQECP